MTPVSSCRFYTRSLLLLSFLCIPGAVDAQGSSSLVGVVRDPRGAPLEGAEVTLTEDGRRVVTSANGSFRFDSLEAKKYRIFVRRLGFYSVIDEIKVEGARKTIVVEMRVLPQRLPAIVTRVSRGGVSGVVHDTAGNPIAGAVVAAINSGRETRTDASGAFYLEIKPGRYPLRVGRDGFATRMVSVYVARDSGRHVDIALARRDGASAAREAVAYHDLQQRMLRLKINELSLTTREDLDRVKPKDMMQIAAHSAVRPVLDTCAVRVNGDVARVRQLWELDPAEIEFFEVYEMTQSERRRSKQPRNRGRQSEANTSCPLIIAWLRR